MTEPEARGRIAAEMQRGLDQALSQVGIEAVQAQRIRDRFARSVSSLIIIDPVVTP